MDIENTELGLVIETGRTGKVLALLNNVSKLTI